MRPDQFSLLEINFINVRTVKTVIRERNNKKKAKEEEKMLLYQREITQDANGHI